MARSTPVRLLAVTIAATLVVTTVACMRPAQGPPAVEGRWNVAGASMGGRELPLAAFANSPLTLTDGRYQFQTDSGEYHLVAGASPAAMDVIGRKGPNAGKTIPTIYKFQGDTLVICYDLTGTMRPVEFSAPAGTRHFLARYTRATP